MTGPGILPHSIRDRATSTPRVNHPPQPMMKRTHEEIQSLAYPRHRRTKLFALIAGREWKCCLSPEPDTWSVWCISEFDLMPQFHLIFIDRLCNCVEDALRRSYGFPTGQEAADSTLFALDKGTETQPQIVK